MLNKKIKQDINILLSYLWRDEKRHYQESGYCKKHIFRVMKRLAKAVEYEY
ncbi:MAG: hypothetical protein V2A72_00455 [Candidatus Omnitrophota bacterium]